MKDILKSTAIWTWVCLLLPSLFIANSAWLIVAVNGRLDDLSANFDLISHLGVLETSIGKMDQSLASDLSGGGEGPLAAQWSQLLSQYRHEVSEIRRDSHQIGGSGDPLRQVDALVVHMTDIRGQLTDGQLAEGEVDALTAEFRKTQIVAVDELQLLGESLRDRSRGISLALAGQWRYLNALVIVSCLVALFLGVGLILHQRTIRRAKITAEALRESEARFRHLAANIDEAFWLTSPDESDLLYVSPAYEAITGQPCESLYADPKSWLDVLHPRDRQDVIASMQARGPGPSDDVRSDEHRIVRRDGTVRWVWMRSKPVYDEAGVISFRAGVAMDITERKQAEEELRAEALRDKLTHLPNRRLIMNRIREAINLSRRNAGYKFAVLFLDFDRFKTINDSLGHEVGDQLLISIAARLNANLRSADASTHWDDGHLPARLGGDEFVILLDEIKDADDATLVAERLQKALSAPHVLGDHEIISTASIGIVTSDGSYDRPEDVIRDADTAMYHAKKTGKARHVVFDEQMHEEVVLKLQLEEDLRRGVDRQEFFLHYQPIVALDSGKLVGFEALIRWMHPERGMVPPTEFIPLAEEIGVIVPIGRWVLDQASRQLAAWQQRFPQDSPLSMNVNLSKREISEPDLVSMIAQTVKETGVALGSLKLEVTESHIVDDLETLIPVLHRLHDVGVQLCLDDFGTGHSSMSCLHRFPIDVLKIDRAFIDTAGRKREYAAVVHAVVALAHNLGMRVVAEGIETEDQFSLLQAVECNDGQGFLLGRPVGAEAAEELLSSGYRYTRAA